MTTMNSGADLTRLGDELEAAAERSLSSARRRRIGRIGIGVVVLTVLAAGTAVATGMFSPRQIAAGLPAGAMIFGGTHPTCALDGDGVTSTARWPRRPPRKSRTSRLEAADRDRPEDRRGLHRHGPCRHDVGLLRREEAVHRQILVEDLLGQPELEPSKG